MSHPFEGVMRGIVVNTVSSGAGATSVNLRPPVGRVWEVIWCTGQQDDGAVAIAWKYIDPDATVDLINGTSAGVGIKWAFGSLTDSGAGPSYIFGRPILTYDRYISYVFTASAGAKTGAVIALVREFRGVAVEV